MKIRRHNNENNNETELITVNDNENVKNVKEFDYLGYLITDYYNDTKEIIRLCVAKNAMVSLTNIWKDKSISLETK